MRGEKVQLVARQACQQLVVQGDTGIGNQHCGFLPDRSGRDPQR
jgi:hypothetical protein